MSTETYDRKIVVGVEGSEASKDALCMAARYAEMCSATLHAVIAWRLPEIYAYTPRDYADDARHALEQAIDDALGEGAHHKLVSHVIAGSAAPALMGLCEGAEMLVVGNHGLGGFSSVLLGSVAQHACCPVLVVR